MSYIVSSGVTSTGIVLVSDSVYISQGIIVNLDRMYVSDGGVANSVTVNSGGCLYISSGGSASAITENGGYVEVADGATATFVANSFSGLVLSSADATLHSGTATATTVISLGFLHVFSGGVANSTTINDYGYLIVEGGTVNYTTLSCSAYYFGYLRVYGGVANNTIAREWGVVDVRGGVVNSTILNSVGHLYVYNGGVANSTTVNSDGSIDVHDGGVANLIIVNNGGIIRVTPDGVANSTTVNNGGSMEVWEGGVANSTTVNNGGNMYISSGGKHTGALTIAYGAVVSAYAGSVIDFDLSVASAGEAARVNNLSRIKGTSDYTVTVSTKQAEGVYTLADGAAGFDKTITVNTDTGVKLGTLSVGGELSLGGYIYRVINDDGALRLTITTESIEMDDLVLADSSFIIGSGGITNRAVVNNNGHLYNIGGMANLTTVNDTGYMSVSTGGVANSTTVNRGYLHVSTGGVANSTTVNRSGRMDVSSGGEANSTTVNSLGYLYVSSGGTANATTVNYSGYLYVSTGGAANSTTVNSDGYLYVSNGGEANSTTVNSRGYLIVSDGGVANSTMVNSGGRMYVSSGGVANGTVLSGSNRGADLTVSAGGVANYTSVMTSGFFYVSGVVNNTVINTNLDGNRGIMRVYGGGVANDTNIISGTAVLHEDGVANSITLNSGTLEISSGGMANSTTVNSGGSVFISSGGKATGTLTIAAGAVVSAYAGSVIDFDVSAVAAGSAARVNDLSLVRGTPNYTVTVSAKQAEGTYFLADGAVGFDKTITVGTESGIQLGTLSVGNTITVSNVDYTLTLDGGALSLGVAFDTTPSAHAEALTEDSATMVYGSDLAARWTADTSAPGAVTLITSDFGGDAWLDIDGAEVAGALYGASCDYSGTVNIAAKSGSIRNLAAGAAAGGSVGAVNLTFAGAELDGTGYAGGFGNVAGEVDTVITSGTFAKDFYAGALANKLATATGVGDVFVTIAGGTFGGNIYGASAVKTDTTKGNGTLHTVGDVTLTVTGGESTKGAQACIFAGGYATGDATGTVYTVDSVTLELSGGSWGTAAGGRGVFGGIMASGVTAQAGDVNLTISGGSMGNVYGGGWAQKGGTSVVGDVHITIAGDAEIANVFGGGSHSSSGGTTVVNDVTITISGGNITGAIFARGQLDGDEVNSAEVIFTGATDFGCDVFGYSCAGGSGSSEALTFAGYTGTFSGDIGGFDVIEFGGATAMTLDDAANISANNWMFDVSERDGALAGAAMLTWDAADFSDRGVTLNLASGSTFEWTLVDAAATIACGEFDVWVDGISQGVVALDQQIADGEFAGWGFALEDTALKFRQLA